MQASKPMAIPKRTKCRVKASRSAQPSAEDDIRRAVPLTADAEVEFKGSGVDSETSSTMIVAVEVDAIISFNRSNASFYLDNNPVKLELFERNNDWILPFVTVLRLLQ